MNIRSLSDLLVVGTSNRVMSCLKHGLFVRSFPYPEYDDRENNNNNSDPTGIVAKCKDCNICTPLGPFKYFVIEVNLYTQGASSYLISINIRPTFSSGSATE